MKNQEIIYLVNAGVLQMTNHNLPAAQAYKAYKFRKAVSKALEAIQDTEQGLLKEAGIVDAAEFDKRLTELRAVKNPGSEQKAELEEKQAAFDKYTELRRQMLKEEAGLSGVKTLPYEEWKTLQDENRAVGEAKTDILSGHVEMLLEDVLWAAPEEGDGADAQGDPKADTGVPAPGDRPAE